MSRIMSFPVDFPRLALFFSLLVAAVLGAGATKLQLATDMEVFFSAGDPQLVAYDEVRNTYTRDDNLFLVLAPAKGEVFTAEFLSRVEEITERAWQLPYTMRVDSITNYQHTEAEGDDLIVLPLVEDAMSLTRQQIAHVRDVATNEPLLRGKLITSDGKITAINLTNNFPGDSRNSGVPEVMAAARALRDEFKERYPDMRFHITGKTAGNNAFTESALYDMSHIIPVATLVALLLIASYLFYASRSFLTAGLGTLSTVMVIACSIAAALGTAGWLGWDISPPVANAPTIILTLAVADCMHLLVTFFLGRRHGKDRHTAMRDALRLNYQAVALTSITTVIGFLALNFSDAPPFQTLGNVVAIGIVAAWAFSVVLLPALMCLLPSRVEADNEGDLRFMRGLADLVIRHPRRSLVSVLVVLVVAGLGLPRNQLFDIWAEYFDESTDIRIDSDFAREHLSGFNSLEFSIGAGEAGAIASPEYLNLLDNFVAFLEEQPEVTHISHFGLIMKRLNRNMHGDDPDWYRVPENRELAAQYLLLYEFSLPFGLDMTNMINLDKSATRVVAGLRSSSTLELMGLQERVGQWLRENAPPAAFHPGASSDAMFAHIGQRNVRSMVIGSFLGLLVISIIIAIALRSVRFGLISLLLNLMPLAVGFGLWGWLIGRVGLGLSVVSGLTMGIVVDYTVHLLSKYRIAQAERQEATEDAIRYAFSTVGVALLVTTAVLGVNFGLFGFSTFALNSEMGTLTAAIIVIALFIDLFFLPPLLLWMDRGGDKQGQPLTSVDSPSAPALENASALGS